jgi:RNA polymerase sigma-70 factor, ECF subfamily
MTITTADSDSPRDSTLKLGFADAVSGHRPYLIRFASRRLRDTALVEDVVQDALLSALQAQAGFDQRSSLRTWLTSILLRRIADSVRGRKRQPMLRDAGNEPMDEPGLADDPDAAHAEAIDCVDPQRRLADRQFLAALAIGLDALPPLSARLFALREFEGLNNEEAASTLGLSARGASLMLHRARASLRARLAPHAGLVE